MSKGKCLSTYGENPQVLAAVEEAMQRDPAAWRYNGDFERQVAEIAAAFGQLSSQAKIRRTNGTAVSVAAETPAKPTRRSAAVTEFATESDRVSRKTSCREAPKLLREADVIEMLLPCADSRGDLQLIREHVDGLLEELA